MKRVFLIGAGRSATLLIEYLLDQAAVENWEITVGDVSEELVQQKTNKHPYARPIKFDINDPSQTEQEVGRADVVISLLPAHMHLSVAQCCVRLKKHLVTASYITPEMQLLHDDAVRQGVLLLNECGLDPGIDHMSAMEIIRDIRVKGGELKAFYSYTGGLVAPESNDNPWGYKFSWNPRNVILAGQGTARYIENGRYKYIPYSRLFTSTRSIDIPKVGAFDGYANRDSLAYRKIYGIEEIQTLLRGTLRQAGYCSSWNVFVQLGLTDDSYVVEGAADLTYAELIQALLPPDYADIPVQTAVARLCGLDPDSEVMSRVTWTGIFSNEKIGLPHATPAQILQQLLESKWKLKPSDKDLVVMQHRFDYSLNGDLFSRYSSLVVTGEDAVRTAMAKTVGLPVGIAAVRLLLGKISERGVMIPVSESICRQLLGELEEHGIVFNEYTVPLT